ncbi:MAG: endonuclease/exonuclease/phosphatase family protein [Proteobacteria bacterium]|nr:endonuclease/exonuclease/phosphatase family protein [Pseudomonadota bacterium]MDE3208844.1 endonuclease/exonuclease/phosphatase family protein [Pseudomonadota bacterium]
MSVIKPISNQNDLPLYTPAYDIDYPDKISFSRPLFYFQLRIATYNIHKGFSRFNQRHVLYELRDLLHEMQADLVFLQEVVGEHATHAERFEDWPDTAQYEFLAKDIWPDFAYGRNAVYPNGHHGNAILSKFPILEWENEDVSAHRFEQRGLLHCVISVPGWDIPLHAVCAHLGLFSRGRRRQLDALKIRIEREVPQNAPLIVAGDFNDWRGEAGAAFASPLHLEECFESSYGYLARSYPSNFPLFRLDRIYVRGFEIQTAQVLAGNPWSMLSDHAPLIAAIVHK